MEAYEKELELSILTMGSIVKLTNGKEAEFVRLKRTKFVAIIDGGSYNVPINMFVSVIEKKETESVDIEKILQKGDLFYITNRKKDALLFKYSHMERGRIIAENPITKSKTRIDVSLFVAKI